MYLQSVAVEISSAISWIYICLVNKTHETKHRTSIIGWLYQNFEKKLDMTSPMVPVN
jgi:hypothetical protein